MKTELLDPTKAELSTSTKYPRRNLGGWARRTALLYLISVVAAGALAVLASPWDVGGKKDLKVYQGNAYVGALIEAPLGLDPSDPNYQMELLEAVTAVYQQIVASDPPARMAALAEEIAAQRPDVAGLEELYTVEMAPDVGQAPGEFTVLYDYLELLTKALAAKGAHYRVAVVSTESDVAMPMIAGMNPLVLAWGRIIDHEAILVRTDLPPGYLQVSNPQTGRFSIYPQVPLGTETISIYRGWCSVDVFTRGERFRLICTHPQDESIPQVQKAEVEELLTSVANVPMPVMIIGDLNSDPLNRNGTDSYADFAAAGFKDTWAILHPQDLAGGLTWGHDAELSKPDTSFVWRLDYVFYRGKQFTPTALVILDPRINTTTPPLWPSDHAAITATFLLGNARALKDD
jgi:Endonuclease/Exonuclease/phosphatase family